MNDNEKQQKSELLNRNIINNEDFFLKYFRNLN